MIRTGAPLVLLAVVAVSSRADEAETERRLKRIDVPKALRDDVRVAIDQGVKFLASKQRADGVWVDPDGVVAMKMDHGNGLNALCALALLHVDTAPARAAAKPAVAKLFPEGGKIAPQLSTTTYGAGLALLLLDAVHGDKERASWIVARLAEGRDPKSGTWNYRTGEAPTIGLHAPTHAPGLSGPLNLSTSQIAALGLHAAGRLGVKVDRAVWGDVLDGMLAGQQTDGSWTYQPADTWFNITYPTGSLMGIANLVLATRHLGADEDQGRGTSRKRRVEAAIRAARTALEADGVLTLWTSRRGAGWMDGRDKDWVANTDGSAVDGYALWSLEKACVFLGIERVDGIPWYADAARTLTKAQAPDGSWHSLGPGASMVLTDQLWTTAFALLVLVRDIESIREITPADEPPPETVTPSAPDAAAKPGVPESKAVPIDVALAALAKFRALLVSPKATNAELLGSFELFERAREDLAPPLDPKASPVDPIALLRGIDSAVLDALFLAGADPGDDEEGRAPVNRRAADFLAKSSAAVIADVRRRTEELFARKKSDDEPLLWTPYRPALGLLASRGGDETFAWMLDDALHDDLVGERAERSLAFLLAVPRFHGLPGAVRLAAAKTIAGRFSGRENASVMVATLTPDADPRNRMRWSRFRPRVLEALLFLATDPETGAEPRDERGRVPLDLKYFVDWLHDHDDKRRAPWK